MKFAQPLGAVQPGARSRQTRVSRCAARAVRGTARGGARAAAGGAGRARRIVSRAARAGGSASDASGNNKRVRSTVRGQAPRSTTFMSTRTFAFDAAFPPAAQTSDVFQAEVSPLVDVVVGGGASCCIMAYGATGCVHAQRVFVKDGVFHPFSQTLQIANFYLARRAALARRTR